MTLTPDAAKHNDQRPYRLRERLRMIRHVALDMDGTIYHDETLFECTKPFLAALGEMGIGHSFLTNNSSRSADDYVAHLRKIGISAQREQIYTSAQATIEFLQTEMPEVKRL